MWRDVGHLVGWCAIAIGLIGVVLHLDSRFFHERTIKSLVYAAPFAAPLAYTGLGLLLVMNRMVDRRSEEWPRWVLLMGLGGFVGNFIFSLTDHAQNGFFHWTEWIPVVSSALRRRLPADDFHHAGDAAIPRAVRDRARDPGGRRPARLRPAHPRQSARTVARHVRQLRVRSAGSGADAVSQSVAAVRPRPVGAARTSAGKQGFAAGVDNNFHRRLTLCAVPAMQYEHLTLRDRGDVLAVYFKQDSILDQQVIDQIGHEFDRIVLEAGSCRKVLLNFEHVKFMSSAMIGKLLTLNKALHRR